MEISLKLKTCSRFFIAFLKSTLNLQYFETKDPSQSLSIAEIVNCERGSYLNVQKAIFHATLRQTTCYRFPNTAEISTLPLSYNSSNNLRYWEYGKVCASHISADIAETENFFGIFFCVSEIYVKFGVFSKKRSVS